MALRNSGLLALCLATYPTHALDLKKELERLRGGAVLPADDDDFFDDDLYEVLGRD